MEEFIPTQEQINNMIQTSFDSVSLINDIINEQAYYISPLETSKVLTNNINHLNVMLSKPWFLGGLTQQQEQDIRLAVTNANSFLFDN